MKKNGSSHKSPLPAITIVSTTAFQIQDHNLLKKIPLQKDIASSRRLASADASVGWELDTATLLHLADRSLRRIGNKIPNKIIIGIRYLCLAQ